MKNSVHTNKFSSNFPIRMLWVEKCYSWSKAIIQERWCKLFRRHAEIRAHFLETIEKFRKKGALSPEKAMTAEELGLPAEFRERMKRRLGRLGVFVEVDGKYYLSEERFREVKDKIAERSNRSWWNARFFYCSSLMQGFNLLALLQQPLLLSNSGQLKHVLSSCFSMKSAFF